MRKILLQLIAAVEAGAGAGLILVPTAIVAFLIGGPVDSPTALVVTRLAGAALVTLGLVCWFASCDSESQVAIGVVTAMTFYNAAAAGLLLFARFGADLSGPGVWPAIVLHGALAAWCLSCVRRTAV